MWIVTLKGLLGHKLRFMLTGLAVVLGVAFMAGTLVLTDTIQVIFDDLVASVNDGTDAFVRSNEVVDSAFGEERNRVSAALLPQVRAVQGVAQAEGDLQFYAQVVDAKGEAIGNPGRGAPSFGFIWNPGRLNAYRLVAGNSPSAAGEVVIDRGTAKKGNLRVGSKVKVLSQSAPQDFKVAGIVTFGEADSPAGASVSLFTSEEAQRLSGAVGQYDGISVSAVDGVSQEQMVRRIDAALSDPKVEVITGATLTKENQDQFTQQLSFFSTALLAFALISLFVGSFIIFNTFSIIVAQRTREIGLMRAIGASRSQIVKSVIAEAALVGILASAVGLGIGILLAAGLKALLAGLGIDIPAGATQVLPRTIIVCLGVGTFVTIAASVLPSRKASRVSPMQALRSTGSDPMKQLGRRSTIGVVITAVGVGSLLYG
ncbi:MAG: ABC transporter permease, partial [Acidimicrobiia bacterium]|nr:ABC transporter permease [Acidimicrobiia bacterium]